MLIEIVFTPTWNRLCRDDFLLTCISMPKTDNNTKKNNSRLSKINRELLIFLVFLFIAVAFWFIQTFKDSLSMSIDYQLRINGIPDSVITTSKVPETINVRVHGRGFQLLKMMFSPQERVVDVDYKSMRDNNKALIIDNELWKRSFDRVLPAGISVSERSLQTLEIYYSNGEHKAVPVYLNGKISAKEEFVVCNVVFNPQMVDVYAPRVSFDTITAIKTVLTNYESLEDTVNVTLQLDPPLGVKCNPDYVNVSICVDMLSSKHISVPIYSINTPQNIVLKPFPSIASISFTVNASRLNEIKDDEFNAVIDYNSIKENDSQCKVNLTATPSGVTNVQYSPHYVEYVIEQLNEINE